MKLALHLLRGRTPRKKQQVKGVHPQEMAPEVKSAKSLLPKLAQLHRTFLDYL